MTRGRLIAKVAADFGMVTDAGHEELLLLQEWVQEGVHDVLVKTRLYVVEFTVSLVAGTADYQLASTVLAIVPDTIQGSASQVRETDASEIRQRRLSGTVAPQDPPLLVAVEKNLFMVWPTPSSNGTMTFLGTPKPTAMSDDDHDPSSATYGGISAEYHDAIKFFTDREAAKYKSVKSPLSPRDYAQIYADRCREIRREIRRRLPPAPPKIGYPGRSLPRRNDTYPVR